MLAWNNNSRNLALFVTFVLLFTAIPTQNLWWREAINSGHTVLFLFISWLIYQQLKIRYRQQAIGILYLWVFIIALLLGGLIEVLQGLVQREASLADMTANLFGILTALCLIIFSNLKGRRYQSISRSLFVLLAAIFFLLGVSPLLQLSWHYIERNNAFPVLIDFTEDWSSSFVQFNDAEMLKVEKLNFKKKFELQLIQFNQGEYPGLSIIEPKSDWSHYKKLRFSIFSAYRDDYKLNLRVHDNKHNQEYLDRYNKALSIRPGLNVFTIDLDQIQKGPLGRELDLSNVTGIILFAVRLGQPIQFAMSNISLE